jgi:hypothetical protein
LGLIQLAGSAAKYGANAGTRNSRPCSAELPPPGSTASGAKLFVGAHHIRASKPGFNPHNSLPVAVSTNSVPIIPGTTTTALTVTGLDTNTASGNDKPLDRKPSSTTGSAPGTPTYPTRPTSSPGPRIHETRSAATNPERCRSETPKRAYSTASSASQLIHNNRLLNDHG